MSHNIDDHELIFEIYRVKSEQGDWMPALRDIKTHDINPSWVAGTLYMLLDRYIGAIEESKQTKFYEETLYWLGVMMKDSEGSAYIEKVNIPKDF